MLDDLRNSAASSYLEEEISTEEESAPQGKQEKLFLGMTASQRFILILMLLMMSCVLGTLCLVVTEKIVLPF